MKGPPGWGAAAVLLMAGLLVVPTASAASVTGQFTTPDQFLLPQGTNVTFSTEAALLKDTAPLRTLNLEADYLDLCQYTLVIARVVLSAADNYQYAYDQKEACFPLSEPRLRLALGDHAGWVGLRPDSARPLAFHTTEGHRVEARNFTRLSDPSNDVVYSESRDSPQSAAFVQEIHGDHLFSEARGVVSYEGPGELKILGPDVEIVSATNSTTYRTGEEWGSGPATVDGTISWLVLRFGSARVTLDSPDAPLQFAARQAEASADGAIEFKASQGSLDVAGVLHSAPEGGIVQIEGQLDLVLSPTPGARGIDLALAGEARSVALAGAGVSLPSRGEGPFAFPWLVFVLGAVALAGGAWWFGRRGSPVLEEKAESLEEAWEYAALYLERRKFDRALAWVRKARALAPRNAALAADEARCLQEMGDVKAALDVYDQAHRLSDEGEYALQAARVLRETGAPLVVLVKKLAEALDKSPSMLYEVEDEFPEAKATPEWARIARLARLRSR